MANELEITGIVRYNKAGVKAELSLNSRVDVSGTKTAEVIQSVSNTKALVKQADVSSLGYGIIENLSDTATIIVSSTSGSTEGDMLKILPNSFAGPMQFNKNAIYVSTVSGSADIRVILISP